MAETIALPPITRRLWKIVLVNDLNKPAQRTALLLRRCDTAFAAMTEAKKTEGWKAFAAEYPGCEIASVELAGITEN